MYMQLSNIHNLSFGNSNINILYFNDMHGSTLNLENFKTAVDEFRKNHNNEANFVLSGGDIYIDNSKSNFNVTRAMNTMLDATAVGNHDAEVCSLESQGINKIILLAHTGEKTNHGKNYYNELAKIGGIDVIIGGHDHKMIDKLTYSNRCEPVRIVSTGQSVNYDFKGNLDLIGELNLEFDDFGVLDTGKTKNTFKETANYTKTKLNIFSNGKKASEVLFELKEPVVSCNPMSSESKVADIVADSNLWYVNKNTKGSKAAFALLNSGTIRSEFTNTDVTQNDIEEVVPFTTSTLIKTKLTKKQIFDTLEWGIKSTKFSKPSPGVIQVAGLKYSVKPDGTIHNVFITNEKGKEIMKLDNLPDNIEFYCVYDIFLATGPAGLSELKKDFTTTKDTEYTEFFDISRQKALCEYFRYFKDKSLHDYSNDRIIFD